MCVAICLGTLRMSHHAVKQKVFQCDDELSEQALAQLLKYLPGPEEVREGVIALLLLWVLIHCVMCVDGEVTRVERSLY